MFKPVTGARAWVLGVGGILGVAGTVLTNAQIAEAVVPVAVRPYMQALMIAGFALALWAVGTTEVPTNPRAAFRASVRIDGGFHEQPRGLALELRNVGDLEAQHVTIDPVSDETFPWEFRIREIGSLAKSQAPMNASIEIRDRADLKCGDCPGKPISLQEFVDYLLKHHAHFMPNDLSNVSPADMEYAVNAHAQMWDLKLPVTVRYCDELGRQMLTRHRLHMYMCRDGGQTWRSVRVEFEDEEILAVR